MEVHMKISDVWSRADLSNYLQITMELESMGVIVPEMAKKIVQAAHDKQQNTPVSGRIPASMVTPPTCKKHGEEPMKLNPCGKGYHCVSCLDGLPPVKAGRGK